MSEGCSAGGDAEYTEERVRTQSSGLLANAILFNQSSNFASLYLSSLVNSGTEEMTDKYS
jgi:hypothetical protein